MRALQSHLPPKHRLSQEWRRALQLIASNPRGTTEHMLVLSHGVSSDVLPMLVLTGLATVVPEKLKSNRSTVKIERVHITDAGRRAIGE